MAFERSGTIRRAVEINSADDMADYWRQTDVHESSPNTRSWGSRRKPVGGASVARTSPFDVLRLPRAIRRKVVDDP